MTPIVALYALVTEFTRKFIWVIYFYPKILFTSEVHDHLCNITILNYIVENYLCDSKQNYNSVSTVMSGTPNHCGDKQSHL